jgi:hypothetical protein
LETGFAEKIAVSSAEEEGGLEVLWYEVAQELSNIQDQN